MAMHSGLWCIVGKEDILPLKRQEVDFSLPEADGPVVSKASKSVTSPQAGSRWRCPWYWSAFHSFLKLFTLLFSLLLAADLFEAGKQIERELWRLQEYYSN